MRIIHLALSHRRMPFSFFVMDLPYDVTFKPPAHPQKKAALTSTSTVTSSHEKIQKGKKKITEPLIDQVVTLLPKGWSFSSLWSVAPNFSPSLFKEQQQALSPLGVQRGLSPVGEGHTSHSSYKRPASLERKCTEEWQRKRTKGLHLKGVFSSVTRVLALWER